MERVLFAAFNYALYNQVTAIHCPSLFAARMLEAHGSKAHFRIISNGIPPEYEPTEAVRPDWFGDRFVLLNVGRHAMEKRQTLLIEGVMRSRYKENIQLILCGRGENTDQLRTMGAQLPVAPVIEYVSHQDKLTYLNSAAPQFALDDRFIFESDNPDVLASGIDYWYEHREILQEMRVEVLRMAENYRFGKCMDELESFYADVVEHDNETNNVLTPGLS